MHDLPILAFDFGLKRIGVATGDFYLKIAHPQAPIWEYQTDKLFSAIASCIDTWVPVACVVGLPRHQDHEKPHELADACLRFARRLTGRFNIKSYMVDEYLSSYEAGLKLSEAQVFGKKRKKILDSMSAVVILEKFFDEFYYEEGHFIRYHSNGDVPQ
jgi:putative Holliday junction resolvase